MESKKFLINKLKQNIKTKGDENSLDNVLNKIVNKVDENSIRVLTSFLEEMKNNGYKVSIRYETKSEENNVSLSDKVLYALYRPFEVLEDTVVKVTETLFGGGDYGYLGNPFEKAVSSFKSSKRSGSYRFTVNDKEIDIIVEKNGNTKEDAAFVYSALLTAVTYYKLSKNPRIENPKDIRTIVWDTFEDSYKLSKNIFGVK